jgi:hypothetical protein
MGRYALFVSLSLIVVLSVSSLSTIAVPVSASSSDRSEAGEVLGFDEQLLAAVEELQVCCGDLARTLRSVGELNNAEQFFRVQRKRVVGIRILSKYIEGALSQHRGSVELRAGVISSLRKLNEDLNPIELGLRGIEKRPTSVADAHELGDQLLKSEAFRALYEKRGITPRVIDQVTIP